MDFFSFKIAAYGLILSFCLGWSVTSNPGSTLASTMTTSTPTTAKAATTVTTTTTTTTKPVKSVILNPGSTLASTMTTSTPTTAKLATTVTTTTTTTTKPPPENVEEFKATNQTENSITLEWTQKEGIALYTLKYNEVEKNFTVEKQYVVPNLSSSTQYDFKLFTVFDDVRSTGANLTAATAPSKVEYFRAKTQNETSITLQWKNENKNINYTLMFNGSEENFTGQQLSNPAEHTVSTLQNAKRYNFTLVTVFANIRGTGVDLSAPTAPRNAQWFKSIGQNETSITLEWEPVSGSMDYIVQSDKNNITVNGSQVTVQALTSATLYNFTLYSVFENVLSSGTLRTAATAPRDATDLKAQSQTETTITLQWNKVDDIRDYVLVINGTKNESVSASSENLVNHTVTNRQSGTLTSFILYTVFTNITSGGKSFSAPTVPPKVSSVKVTKRTTTGITLQWESARRDWNYTFYINSTNKTVHRAGGSTIISHSVESLKPGTVYEFHVTTEFESLKSAPYEDRTVTTINCAEVDWSVTESTIHGVVEGLFTKATAANGSQEVVSSGSNNVSFAGLYPGATYTITLMYEELEQCSNILQILTRPPMLTAECKDYAAGYSIYIKWDKPNGIWDYVEVNVSGRTHKVDENREQFAELPNFQPAKKYQVSIASISGPQRSAPYVFTCATDARGVIAGAFFGVLLFLILVCAIAFIMLKRPDIIRQKLPLIGGSRASVRKSKVIPVAKFPSHFNKLSADENRGFSIEYEDLSLVGTDQTQKAAIIQENKPKNRFVNVLPYDRSRVKLSTSNAHDDYINASYMPGYNGDKEFIAAQGPMPSTVNDFWRMVWEQKARGIVMVTNCTEGGRTKCEQYWPAESKSCVCGDLMVSTTSEETESDWTLREFKIKHKQTSEERTVKHFHFTVWPDHGVPLGTEVLIQFRALVRRHIQTEAAGTPTVVHCSAGVGRTGTIIALDVLLQQLEKEQMVDINGFVHRMRLNRPHMVQTESQYVFLHQCIMDSLQPSEKCEEHIYENQDMIYANATALREFHNNMNNV